ncbi:hypothetical protein LAZ67_1000810, partial [Cordylochernes scorpioides]
MAEELILRLKKKRAVNRSYLTKTCNKIESGLDTLMRIELEELLEQLNESFNELKVVDHEIETLLETDDLEKELQGVEEYREKYITWRFRANKKIRQSDFHGENIPNSNSRIDENEMRHYVPSCTTVKLPKLMISKFYGNFSEWLTFWNSFDAAIHQNNSLNPIDKFNYLKSHLGGTALNTVEGFALSADNYEKAIKLLKDRFGREDILISRHMNNLLSMRPLKTSSDVRTFRELFDNLSVHIRSLESLNVSIDVYGQLLCPIIIKLLPADLNLELNKELPTGYVINDLITFLERQLTAREKSFRNEIGTGNESTSKPNLVNKHPKTRFYNEKPIATASELLNSVHKSNECVFCGKDNHGSPKCDFAANISLNEKRSLMKKKGVCYKCLRPSHLSKFCRNVVRCSICNMSSHLDVMCTKLILDRGGSSKSPTVQDETLANLSTSPDLLLPTLRVTLKGNRTEKTARAIIDTGSQRSYILHSTAMEMEYEQSRREFFRHSLFGGSSTDVVEHEVYTIHLSDINNSYRCEFEALGQSLICGSIPPVCPRSLLEGREELDVSDLMRDRIEVLIGADIAGRLLTDDQRRISSGLVAIRTKLGWTVMGKIPPTEVRDDISSLCVTTLLSLDLENLWKLDAIGVSDAEVEKKTQSLQAEMEEHFAHTTTRDIEGRYEVALPWVQDKERIPSNKDLAENQLRSVRRKLEEVGDMKEYGQIFEEWMKQGIIEYAREDKLDGVHYLPHRPVYKRNSQTSRIRPVFNASARKRGKLSLNDCLDKGPNLIEIIPRLLNKFRKYQVGVSSDIEKAFLQIGIKEEDRDYLRFLWHTEDGRLITYRHKRVVFGITTSPYLLKATLSLHLDKAPEHLKITAEQLKSSFYVDNCLSSFQNVEETEKFVKESTELLSTACFNLRDWVSNVTDFSLMNQLNKEVNILGITWNTDRDTLTIGLEDFELIGPTTKRKVLSIASKIFDPLGVACPVTLIPKLILQETWIQKLTWDEVLPGCLVQRFWKWEDNWAAFVMNRVKEIHNLSSPESWRHIPGRLNPADLPSRGCSAESLKETRWWEGPAWLKVSQEEWPKSTIIPDLEIVYSERRKTILNTLCTTRENENSFGRYSHFLRIVRITAWIYIFFNNAKIDRRKIISEDLSTEEITKSEIILIRLIQRESFSGHEDKKLQGFKLLVDSSGILRIKTKICRREDFANFRMPILLPSDHFLVSLLIRWNHETHGHAGLQTLLGILRENYWILRSRKTVKKIINQCIRCKRFTATPATVESTSLPEDRVRDAAVFEIVGVDLTGHLILKNKKKAWIVIFTCAVYRGVHLELATSLSMEAFLQAFRRFIARRGRPLIVYSDNGTNFKGIANALKKIDFSRLKCDPTLKNIAWKFIPPGAPWWGGWWERLIGMMKQLLFRILGQTSLGYEELSTVMCDVESLMNTRPLTYLTEESEDLAPLTPSLFLHEGRTQSGRSGYWQSLREESNFDECDAADVKSVRWQSCMLYKGSRLVEGGCNTWPLAKTACFFEVSNETIRLEIMGEELKEIKEKIEKLYDELFSLDEVDIDKESEAYDGSMNKIGSLRVKIENERKLKDKLADIKPNGSQANIKLPQFDLPIYDGDRGNWINFKELFLTTIDAHPGLTNIQKLQYLNSAVKGEAARLIRGFPLLSENYGQAWSTLLSRYDNPRELAYAQVSKIFSLRAIKNPSAKCLHEFMDVCNEAIRNLETLELKRNQLVDVILVHFLQQKLSENLRLDWELSVDNTLPSYDKFIAFISRHARSMSCAVRECSKREETTGSRFPKCQSYGMLIEKSDTCILCKSKHHPLYMCNLFCKMPLKEKLNVVKGHKLCFNCLRKGHFSWNCRLNQRCKVCKGKHHTMIHYDKPSTEGASAQVENTTPKEHESAINLTNTQQANCNDSHVLLATARIKIKNGLGKLCTCRALLDSGSQVTMITKGCCERLGLVQRKSDRMIIGVGNTPVQHSSSTVSVTFFPLNNSEEFSVEAVVTGVLTSEIPNFRLKDPNWPTLKNLKLADPEFYIQAPIDMILGADIYTELMLNGSISLGEGLPMAINTRLGWVLLGKLMGTSESNTEVCNLSLQSEPELEFVMKRFWETESVPSPDLCTQDEDCERLFSNNHGRDSHGRYWVKLPFRQHRPLLGESREKALRRFLSLEGKLCKNVKLYDQYRGFMKEYEQLNHMERVPIAEVKRELCRCYYMPHHPEDADYQRILWRPSPEEPVVDYGTTSAPFLAMRTLQQLAEDEGQNYPEASRVTLNDFYVDDLLTGAQTIAEAKELIDQLKDLMKKGGFHLRKWNSNCHEIVSHVEEMNEERKINLEKGAISKILGIVWDYVQDTFRVNITLPEEVVTKRDLLSNITRIFDPIGFLSPTTVAMANLQRQTAVKEVEDLEGLPVYHRAILKENGEWPEVTKAIQCSYPKVFVGDGTHLYLLIEDVESLDGPNVRSVLYQYHIPHKKWIWRKVNGFAPIVISKSIVYASHDKRVYFVGGRIHSRGNKVTCTDNIVRVKLKEGRASVLVKSRKSPLTDLLVLAMTFAPSAFLFVLAETRDHSTYKVFSYHLLNKDWHLIGSDKIFWKEKFLSLQICYTNKKLLLFPRMQWEQHFCNLYNYRLQTDSWGCYTTIPILGEKEGYPKNINHFTIVQDCVRAVFVHAGKESKYLWKLNLKSKQWTELPTYVKYRDSQYTAVALDLVFILGPADKEHETAEKYLSFFKTRRLALICVFDIVENPPVSGKYAALKERLLLRFGRSRQVRTAQVSETKPIADQRPSIILVELSKPPPSQHCDPCTPTSNSLQHLEQTAFPRDMNVTTTAPVTTVHNVEDTNSSSTLLSPSSSLSDSSSLDSSSFCSNLPSNTISCPPETVFSTPVHSDNPLPQQAPSHEEPLPQQPPSHEEPLPQQPPSHEEPLPQQPPSHEEPLPPSCEQKHLLFLEETNNTAATTPLHLQPAQTSVPQPLQPQNTLQQSLPPIESRVTTSPIPIAPPLEDITARGDNLPPPDLSENETVATYCLVGGHENVTACELPQGPAEGGQEGFNQRGQADRVHGHSDYSYVQIYPFREEMDNCICAGSEDHSILVKGSANRICVGSEDYFILAKASANNMPTQNMPRHSRRLLGRNTAASRRYRNARAIETPLQSETRRALRRLRYSEARVAATQTMQVPVQRIQLWTHKPFSGLQYNAHIDYKADSSVDIGQMSR